MTILLHLDLPSWTNAGGVIVLPMIIAVAAMAAVGWLRDRADR